MGAWNFSITLDVSGRGDPTEKIEESGIGPHQDAGLAGLDTSVDDLRGLVGRGRCDRFELGGQLFSARSVGVRVSGSRALRTMLVFTPPGWTETAVTPLPRNSWRSDSVKPRTANLAAQ